MENLISDDNELNDKLDEFLINGLLSWEVRKWSGSD